jgi:hypothetical protein
MNHLVHKYMSLLSHRLRNFKRKGPNLYNFSCPFCHDSKKNKNKARGYIFERKGQFFYKCHNCPESKKFPGFLNAIDQQLYKEYTLEVYKDEKKPVPKFLQERAKPKHLDGSVFDSIFPITNLPDTHLARKFLVDRKIPKSFYPSFYYAPKYKEFVNSKMPGKLTKGFSGPRLVIPFRSFNGEVLGWQARALDNDTIRYNYCVMDETLPRAYGLDRLNPNQKYYVVEGPFDSMFLDNAIAVGGSDLSGALTRLGIPKENAVMVFDNEKKNQEILQHMDKAINQGYNICIWPKNMLYKDINDLRKLGDMSSSEIMKTIDDHTYNGILAKLEFTQWKNM